MRIAVDAMGGDFGPKVNVEGALRAAEDFDVEVLLVGAEDVIRMEISPQAGSRAKVNIINAPDAIGMGEGKFAFRRRQKSSIRIGTQLVKDGKADAFVSMGNTAAVVAISQSILGPLRGVEKPALSLLVPSLKGPTLLVDVGASVNCRPRNLVQFALMGRVFLESVLGRMNPRIGLMSIGEEKSKGNDLTRQVFQMLQEASLNFIGNVEGKDLFSGKADIIVSDGFTGNVAIKASEGIVETILHIARTEIMKNLFAKIGFLLMKSHLKKVYKKVDYSEYGGAHLLGVNGVCIIGHGRSNSHAVRNAIRLAKEFVVNRVQEKIQDEIAQRMGVLYGIKA
jgi:glycerol-3-phosphate acyltransferase PlsX